ncbi:MAG: alpha/beta fold hydrolase [Pseudomonadota bacterium]
MGALLSSRGLIVAAALCAVAAAAFVFTRSDPSLSADTLEARYFQTADSYVEIGAARLRVRREGEGDATPLILIHGFTFSLETWDAWAAALASDRPVIRYDLLGHGLTGPDPEKRYAIEERVEILRALLDALDVPRAHIGGNSLGGAIAWRFAAAYPEMVDRLVLVSPAAYALIGDGSEPAPIPAPMRYFLNNVPEAGVRASGRVLYTGDPPEDRITTIGDLMRAPGNGAAFIDHLLEFTLPNPDDALTSIAAPTLIFWGEDDALIPLEHGERMAAAMPGATLVPLPGAGHLAHEEAAEATSSAAAEFLDAATGNARD